MQKVALFTRAWIEINIDPADFKNIESPSSRGRGLKLIVHHVKSGLDIVALFTRAWIEIIIRQFQTLSRPVALFTRAWIEITCLEQSTQRATVALFTRAWIEIRRI